MQDRTLYGIFLIIASVLAFSLMASMVKLTSHISPVITLFVRFGIGLGILGVLALFKRIKLNFVRSPLLFLRGLSGGISVALYFIAILKVGMGKSAVYSYAYPVFAVILGAIFLKEKVKPVQWLIIFAAFSGILMMSLTKMSLQNFNWFELLAMASGITNAISIVIIRKLHETDNSYSIFFAQSVIGFWMFMVPANLPEVTGDASGSYLLILIGVIAAVAQLLNTEGLRHVPVATGSPFHMLIPVVNIAIGIVIFGEQFNLHEYIGAGIVVMSCVGLLVYKAVAGNK